MSGHRRPVPPEGLSIDTANLAAVPTADGVVALLQLPGTPELVVILLVLLLLVVVPAILVASVGIGGYLLFFRDDDEETVDSGPDAARASGGESDREIEDV